MSEAPKEGLWIYPKSRADNLVWALFWASESVLIAIVRFAHATTLWVQITQGVAVACFGYMAVMSVRRAARRQK